jgi:hypothetical protein
MTEIDAVIQKGNSKITFTKGKLDFGYQQY